MKKIRILLGIVFCVAACVGYRQWVQVQDAKCLFYREGRCVACETADFFPVGYKEACAVCSDRTAYYVEGGLFPAWQCGFKQEELELPLVSISSASCPDNRPLKDVLGNCYSCEVDVPVKIAHEDRGVVCQKQRYMVPDQLFVKSMKCPDFTSISDAEVCVACGGVVASDGCVSTGTNRFCAHQSECHADEWCYPFKMTHQEGPGVCAPKTQNAWFCSATDGYDVASVRAFCAAQGAHIPTLDEIENAGEDLSQICPTLDVWTFFEPDGVVWLESFTQEFLFTREGESQTLGGHTFHALCHKD